MVPAVGHSWDLVPSLVEQKDEVLEAPVLPTILLLRGLEDCARTLVLLLWVILCGETKATKDQAAILSAESSQSP